MTYPKNAYANALATSLTHGKETMSKQNNTVKKLALYGFGTLTGIALSLSVQSFANEKDKSGLPVQGIRTWAEAYGQIKANYVETTDDDKLLENAIQGMVSSLDPHSDYMSPKDFVDLKENTSGEFGGLGMEIGSEDGFIKVIAPIEDTPAERAGVKSGDYITKINETSTRGMSSTEAVKLMRGKPNTKITLTLSRKDTTQPIVVHLTRAVIKVNSVRSHLLEPGIGYVRITQFQQPTLDLLTQNVQKLTKQNGGELKGLILDLRDDPGGLLTGAVGVSAAFLPADSKVVSTKGRDGKEGMNLKASKDDYAGGALKDPLSGLPASIKNIPMTILINSGSASASEIVAGALQDHKRAVLVGTQSFGKGSVQTVLPLSNGGGIKLTTALYYTPNDRSIQAQGILPDVEVKDKSRTFETREADYRGHIANPNGGEESKGGPQTFEEDKAAASEAVKEVEAEKDKNAKDKKSVIDEVLASRIPNPAKDAQLAKALELVKSPDAYKTALGKGLDKAKLDAAKKDKDKAKADE